MLKLVNEQILICLFFLKIAQTGTNTKILFSLYIIHNKTTYNTVVLYEIGFCLQLYIACS